ncbi:MAG: hypothetical protein RLZZ444_658 [Pseudomonadota bacterium]|jgi:hypothetical protein
MRPLAPVLTSLLILGLAGSLAIAEEARNRTDYTIALSGLPLASAVFQAVKHSDDYEIEAQIHSTGLANVITSTKAWMRSVGTMHNGHLKPQRFFFQYHYGKRNRLFDTSFKNGNVVSSIIEPKPKESRRKNWIEIRPEHLKAVTDPIAAFISPADSDPCRAKIQVYDGEARLDLMLEAKGTDQFRTHGFSGSVIKCSLRYVPRSGYRKNHSDIEYVRKLKGIEIWFAKSAILNVYAPVFLSVPTKYGTLTMRATRFDG